MTDLATRRQAEIARYGPEYWGIMRLWRQDIVRAWLEKHRPSTPKPTYLDVSCGKGETMAIGRSLHFESRGCEVAPWLCERLDVDLYPGLHNMGLYLDDQFVGH